MNISKNTFFSVASDLKIPQEQIEAFWNRLEKHEQPLETPFAKFLFYLGAMIVISAMTWFMTIGSELFGRMGLFIIAVTYAIIFTIIGYSLWNKKGLRTPGGLSITIAVCMVPLAIYGLWNYFNLWPNDDGNPELYRNFYYLIDGRWVFMELGTILAGIIALRFFPFSFITAPIFFAAWFLTLDIIPFIFGKEVSWETRCWISLCLGLALLIVSFILDRKEKKDYAFWGYLFGTLAFWLSLNGLVWDKGHFVLFIYMIVNLVMMALAILVRRNVLMVFGALGIFAYLGYLTYEVFENSILFPFVLSGIGLGIIYLGILYQKNLNWIESKIFNKLPSSIRKYFDVI